MTAVGDRVQAERHRVLAGREHRVRVQPREHLAAARRERLRVVADVVLVEDEQRRVQVVEVRVHQRQADHRDAEELLHLAMGLAGRTETGAGQHVTAGRDQVALALAHRLGAVDVVARRLEPHVVVVGLGAPLRRVEEGAEDAAVDDDRRVRGEDHVRETGHRRHRVDGVAVGTVGVDQRPPLLLGEIDVHLGVGMHPGVDRVLHGEVSGFADEKAPPAPHTGVGHRGVPPLPVMTTGVDTTVGRDQYARQAMKAACPRRNAAS